MLTNYSEERLLYEAYYGKTPTLDKAVDVINLLITEIRRNPLADYTNHRLNKKLEDLLVKQFGFNQVYIVWKRMSKAMANAGTVISVDCITRNYAVENMDKTKGLYDKSHSHVFYVEFSSQMILTSGLTAEEVLAILLHEIGHNFDTSPYMIVLVGFQFLKKCVEAIQGINEGNFVSALQPAFMTNPGKRLYGAISSTVDRVKDVFPVLKKISMGFKNAIDFLVRGLEYISFPLTVLSLPLVVIVSPLAQLGTSLTRKTEEFADSFATAYGYGPELASALSKIDKTNIIDKTKTPKLYGMKKTLGDLAMAQRYVMSACMGDHGSTDTRMKTTIEMLEKDLNRSDYPPEIKREIKRQITEINMVYDSFMALDPENAQGPITRELRNFFAKVFNGRSDYIAKLFPENNVNRFESTEDEEKYFIIASVVDERINNGELSIESGYELYDAAFDRYFIESMYE